MIQVEQLVVSRRGLRVLDGLTLRIEPGEAYGLVGPDDGARALLGVLAGFEDPDSGWALVAGAPVGTTHEKSRSRFGYLPASCGYYEDLSVARYLEFFAAAYRVEPRRRGRAVEEVLAATGLSARKHLTVRTLEGQERRLLALARALVHDPPVLGLDDPLAGLDDDRAGLVVRLLEELVRLGKTVLIAGNHLDRLEGLLARAGRLAGGALSAEGSPDRILPRPVLQP